MGPCWEFLERPRGGTIDAAALQVRRGRSSRLCLLYRIMLPCYRWVDDFFAAEPEESLEAAMHCFVRIAKAVLGDDAVSSDKCGFGNPLPILGMSVELRDTVIKIWPVPEKVSKWRTQIRRAQSDRRLSAHDASKLGGRLSFAAQNIFTKLGRAMVRPLFQQQYDALPGGALRPTLSLALSWWDAVLAGGVGQERCVVRGNSVVDLFCDASGKLGRTAAVLFADGRCTCVPSLACVLPFVLFDAQGEVHRVGSVAGVGGNGRYT